MVNVSGVLIALLIPAVGLAEEKPKSKPAYIGVQMRVGKEEGSIEVVQVIKDGPAEKAGLQSSDVILRINGIKPANLSSAVKVIRLLTPGKKSTLLIQRDGKEKKLQIVPDALER